MMSQPLHTFETSKYDRISFEATRQFVLCNRCIAATILIPKSLQGPPPKPVLDLLVKKPSHEQESSFFQEKPCHDK